MIEVFATNVSEPTHAIELEDVLQYHFPLSRISFDLDDCDRILRVEGDGISQMKIVGLLAARGYECRKLD